MEAFAEWAFEGRFEITVESDGIHHRYKGGVYDCI